MAKESTNSMRAMRQFAEDKQIAPLIKQIANSIKIAHRADPSKWGLRVNKADLMLKVGFVEVLQAGDGWFHFLAERALVPDSTKRDRRIRFDRQVPYKNAPGCISCDMEISVSVKAYAALKRAHESALQIAARGPRHTSTANDHSGEFVEYLSAALGDRLPQPSYYRDEPRSKSRKAKGLRGNLAFREGAVDQILMNRYERDRAARRECILHYGAACVVCGVDFEEQYGPAVSGLIHVHHVTPLSNFRKSSLTNPVRDLRPVCPNCHAVIHSTDPPRKIDQVKRMLRR